MDVAFELADLRGPIKSARDGDIHELRSHVLGLQIQWYVLIVPDEFSTGNFNMLDSEIEQSQHTGGLRFFHNDWHRLVGSSCRANHNVNYRTLGNQGAQAKVACE